MAKRKRRKRSKSTALAVRERRVRVAIEALEIARGHDGFLRGVPEPVIVAGLFAVTGRAARLAARAVWRFETPGELPCAVEPAEPAAIDARVGDAPSVLLALAVEDDGGGDVELLYAALERADALALWPRDGVVPGPLAIDELATEPAAWRTPRRVELLLDGAHAAERCAGDDWVDAAALVLSPGRGEHRIHLVSPDGRNDWTALATVR